MHELIIRIYTRIIRNETASWRQLDTIRTQLPNETELRNVPEIVSNCMTHWRADNHSLRVDRIDAYINFHLR